MTKKVIAKSYTKRFLLHRDYKLLAEDFATDKSVIEFIFKDKNTNEIVFIPVRLTKYKHFLFNDEKEKYLERREILKTMKWFLAKHGMLNEEVRVDLAEVSIDKAKANIKYSKKVIC